ncbi:hypothetical protein SAMN05216213_101367 [Ectopseudomonas guguanensis]|jgi:hypothetical protein|uniref:Uncharacterized protein n=1 Tax=Ectopseudomonas guguanensis TaxID=1198456 RepID=A0A1H0KRQ0_9GAMM|nr:hypothetical protein SAMN05216213_101367 [Pseudomonas guguanensis]
MSGDKIICVSEKVSLAPFQAEGRKLCGKLAWRGELLRKARVYLGKLIRLRVQTSSRRNEENAC